MTGFRYESPFHLYNSIKKMLRKRNIDLVKEVDREDLRSACEEMFYFLEDEDNAIIALKLGLRNPIKVLTWITNQEEFSRLEEYLYMVYEAVNGYSMIFANKKIIPGYEQLLIQKWDFDYRYREDSIINDKTVSDDFIKDMDNIRYLAGVYFLYNSSKNLIYVGKSQGLGGRIPSSVRERKATYYGYALTKTYSDAGIYEMYYIGNLKPKLNVDGNYPDKPTVKLPELEQKGITKVFSNKRGGHYVRT